jgi:hypothetical protein
MHRCEQYLPGTCKINLDLDGEAMQKMEISEEQLIRSRAVLCWQSLRC